MLYSSLVRGTIQIALLAPAFMAAAYGQTSGKAEFEAASIKANPPQSGFHFAADAVSGGPGTADPGLFRCSRCSLATLIVKAFNLQPYQFPGRTSLTDSTYEVLAKIPAGATPEEFSAMLQNLLKDRFGLTWHFQEKKMKGYRLVIAKDGPKLKESTGAARRRSAPRRQSESTTTAAPSSLAPPPPSAPPTRPPPISPASSPIKSASPSPMTPAFPASTTFPSAGPPLAPPPPTPPITTTAPGPVAPDTPATMPQAADPSGPTLFDALQQQLGLKLLPADQSLARLLVIDHVAQRPTEN